MLRWLEKSEGATTIAGVTISPKLLDRAAKDPMTLPEVQAVCL